jgi:(p)ppGpp synthase/HD superfamily hydrolase
MKKTKSEVLEVIKTFADRSHGTQVRKYTGDRYIVHPVRVMETVRQYNDNISVLAAALLHDVLEDTAVTEGETAKALNEVLDPAEVTKCLQLVVELTDIFIKKDYPRLNRRSRKEKETDRLSAISAEAQTIKYADIIDNVTDIVKCDVDFARVYVREARKMLVAMDAGNPVLHERALILVDECLNNLPKQAATLSPR